MLFKKLRIFFLSLLFFSLFISCENAISYDDEEENQSSLTTEEIKTTPSVKYGSVNGSYQNYGGALPSGIQKVIAKADYNKLDFQNRSAIPALGSELNQIEYYVIARAEGEEPVSGSVSEEDKTFSISGLKFGIDWDIEVGINVKQIDENGNISWLRCFYDTTENVKLSQTELSITRNLILKPDTSGYGSVDLDLTADSNITGLEIKLDNEEQRTKWQTALAADSEKEISASKIKLANLQSGQYDLTLLFTRSGESYPCYSTTQTINVINGMTTDTWQSNGTSLISTTGEFNLTSAIISNYVDSCIYVGPNSASSSIGVTPDNSNEGRAYSPLESVNEAIKRIRNANVRRDYKIFVSGECAENIKIGGEGADVLPGTAASSITIQGLNNNAADVLTAPLLSTAPCLSIQTDIPVIFKNIKITTNQNTFLEDYSSSEKGGGLYIKTGAASPGVTLDSGALIDGCIISGTEAKGAGIYLDSGKLTIKTGAKISNNHFPNSSGFGGGIYIKSGAELILSGSFDIPYGGSVTQNDIYVEAAESIKIKNAISPQAGTSSGVMAIITPAQDLQRGVSIVSIASGSSLSSIVPYKDYFALSNNDWIIKANSAGNALIIDAPIYVAGSANTLQFCSATGSDTGNGTKSAPCASIEQALAVITALNAKEDYTIYVDGKINGQQTIPASFTSDNASSLTIQGASGNTNDSLDGNSEGSVLTISSPVPVTIKDLKITGGYGNDGAGIKAEAEGAGAYLVLDQGCLITENDAGSASGGGVSIRGGTLIMRGNAEISECYGTWGGGIRAQDADASAIQTLVILEGKASIKDCTGSEGGGIGLIGSRVFLYVRDNAEISGNTANTDGGGIRLFGSTANISGGLIKENKAVSAGGAVSVKNDGVLNLSGSVWIPEGVTDAGGNLQKGSCKNDIYLADSRKVTIAGALTPPAAANGIVASITPENWTRGLALIEADNTHVTDLTSYKDYFALTNANDGWNFKLSSDNKALKLDAPIYVAGQTSHPYTGVAGKTEDDGGNGTKSAPYSSIFQAMNAMNVKEDYTIYVDGKLTSPQVISDAISDKANSITVKGINGLDEHGEPNDVIDADWQSNAFTISGGISVTLESLKITKGSAADCGGIEITGNTTVILGNDLIVTGNMATSGAGGIKIQEGSSLIVKGNAKVYGNNTLDGKPSNVYLADGQTIWVIGALTNGSKKAQIGISTAAEPDAASKVTFTSGYGMYNYDVSPDTYFTGDKWTVAAGSGTSAGEAVLAASGGGISIVPIYENISISIDKTIIAGTAASKVFNFTATGEDADANGEPDTITAGTGEGKISYTYTVSYHGETVPQDNNNTYYTPGTSSITFKDSMPAGSYFITVQGTYNGRTYSADFNVNICDEINAENLTEELYENFAEINLSSAAGMNTISQLCSSGKTFADKTVSLNDNITLDSNYTAISDFRGVFDGHNHTISGLNNQSALFDKLNGGGTIKRLTVAGTSTQAGIVRILSNGTVEDCVSKVNITHAGNDNVGGIASEIGSYGTIRNCVNKGTIISSASGITGGILGYAWATTTCIIENCINKGNISTRVWSGGIVGYFVPNSSSYIRNCKNTGTITCANSNRGYGGIVGYTSSKRINNCCNTGTITGAEGVTENKGTGIIACFTGNPHLENNCNIGSVTFGILGPATNDATGFSPSNNYSLSTAASGGAWSTIKESSNDLEFFSSMTDDMIKSFNATETDVDTVVAALNSWVTSNDSSVYASWIKNAEGKPELNLGDLENR